MKKVWKGWIGKTESGEHVFRWTQDNYLGDGAWPIAKVKGKRYDWSNGATGESEWPPKRVTVTVEVSDE